MSSVVVSTSAAPGRPFLFDADSEEYCHPERSEKCAKRISRGVEGSLGSLTDPRLASITPASHLEIRPAPEMVTSGIPALDTLTGGLPRGCLTEICGPASSGRTSVMLAALAAATRRGEYCAVIDASDSLDPQSLDCAGIDLDRLLWVRCNDTPRRRKDTEKNNQRKEFATNNSLGQGMIAKGTASAGEARLEQVLRVTDLLLESGGFGLIILDLSDIPPQSARRIPLTTWFRFRRAVEHKPTVLLSIEQQPIAGSCSSLLLQLGSPIAHDKNSVQANAPDEPAAKRRKNTAHDASRGEATVHEQAPEGRKNLAGEEIALRMGQKTFCIHEETPFDRPSHAQLFTELTIDAELIRSRLDRKPARSVTFETKTAWAG